MKTHQDKSLKLYVATALPILLWGSSYLIIRFCLQKTTPYPPGYSACGMALLRYLIASFAMIIPYGIISFKRHVRYKDYPPLLLNGFLGIGLYTVCVNLGEEHSTASVASFIVSMMTLFIMFLSVLFLGEKLVVRHFGFALLSLGGLGLIAWEGGEEGSAIQGIPYLLLATLAGAIFTILQKKSLNRYHPCQVTAFSIWGGTLSMIIFLPSLLEEIQSASYQSTIAVGYLGIFSSVVAFTLYTYALAHQSPSQLSIYMYLIPIITTLLELFVSQQIPSLFSLIGEGLVLLGVILIQWDKRRT